MRVFIGVDSRQPLAYTALATSIMRRASGPVAITPLLIEQLPITRRGLTSFTFTRYLVPWLCGFEGRALFLDADMLCLADVYELNELSDDSAVQVVKHPDPMRFEWPSLMWFNCEKCTALTPEFIENGNPHVLEWGEVGELPKEWNHLVGYDDPNPDAKIAHFTMGIPHYDEVSPCEFAKEWHADKYWSHHSVSWLRLMGQSVHAPHVLARFLPQRGQEHGDEEANEEASEKLEDARSAVQRTNVPEQV